MRKVPIYGFWHVCMINHWEEIIHEQYDLLSQSGLIDAVEKIYIGAVGSDIAKLESFIRQHRKLKLEVYSGSIHEYEFPTLKLLHKKSIEYAKFTGFYIHTKGVSYPGHEGGKYWRDYMNYYNISRWRDAKGKIQAGYDLCGVKLRLSSDPPARKLHYSGNFFWFNSDYVRKLPVPTFKIDRFSAEMWVGCMSPNAATLCQLFVDYNTKGKFTVTRQQGKIYVHTLCYNLPSEVEKSVKLLYERNDARLFRHYIVDLGFPLIEGDKIPADLEKAKTINTEKLKDLCRFFGSSYIKIDNVGVSQNWTQMINHCALKDEDVIIGLDPDERPLSTGWVEAMYKALQNDSAGMVTLMMPEQAEALKNWNYTERIFNGVRILDLTGSANWALIGFSGKFTKLMKEVPYPATHPRYGYIETFVREKLLQTGYKYFFLPDYTVYHTDYPRDAGSPKLLREWKNQIIFNFKEHGQISFEKFLTMKKQGKFPDQHTLKYKTC